MQDPSLYGQMNPTFPEPEHLKCPRCDSPNTKFCYYNNYNLSQPRHFCKSCKRYWTKGGVLRNIPVGGGSRKSTKRSSTSKRSSTPPPPAPPPPPSSSSTKSATVAAPTCTTTTNTAAVAITSSSVVSAASSKADDYQMGGGAAFDHGGGMVDKGGACAGGDGNFSALLGSSNGGQFCNFSNGSNLQLGEFVNSSHNPGSATGSGSDSALLGPSNGGQFGNLVTGSSQNRSNLGFGEFGNSNQNSGSGSGSGLGSDEGSFSALLGSTNGGQFGNFIDGLSRNGSYLQLGGEFGNSNHDVGSDFGSGSGSGSSLGETRNFDLQMGLLDSGGDNNTSCWSGGNGWPDLAI